MELLARSGLTRLRLLLSEGVEPRRELVEPVQEGLKKRAWKTKKSGQYQGDVKLAR